MFYQENKDEIGILCNGHYNRKPDLGDLGVVVEHVGLSKAVDTRREGTRS